MLQMLDDGVVTDTEDDRDLPVGFPAGGPQHAIALTVRHRHGVLRRDAGLRQPPGALECEPADQLRYQDLLIRKLVTGAEGKGARTIILARHIGRDREPVAYANHSRLLEDLAIRGALAEALRDRHVDVWFDRFRLNVGNTLCEKIDKGLAEADFGIVIVSPAFFTKRWTNGNSMA